MAALAAAWPEDRPTALYASPLLRAMESAELLADAFRLPIVVRPCLREWAPDVTGIPQPDYEALEAQAWDDLTFVPPSGESLEMAARRGRACLESIAAHHEEDSIGVVGHGTLFSLLTAPLQARRPSPAYKASIGFAHTATVRAGSALALARDFGPPGVTPRDSKPL
jgi:broad specificity phosphatase PhoE